MNLKRIADQRLARVTWRARLASIRPDYSKVRAYLPARQADAEEPSAAADERRRHRRVAAGSGIMVRRIGASHVEVELKDISAAGCRVVMPEPAPVGDPVIARMPQLEPLGARVCWTEGAETGVQFLRTLHPAVFDMMIARLRGEAARTT
jgi:PilZ domain